MYEVSRLKQLFVIIVIISCHLRFRHFTETVTSMKDGGGGEQFRIITSSAKLASYDSYLSAQL